MRPNSADVIIRPDLSALLYSYMFDPSRFQMLRALPIFSTPEQTGKYPVIPKEAFLKVPDKMSRAPRAAYARDEIEFGQGDYSTEDRGLEIPLDDTERRLYRNLFSAEEVITRSLASKMLRKHEISGTALLTNTNNFANAAASKKWNLKMDCDPRSDIIARAKAIRDNTGMIPDSVIMGETSFQDILACAAFIDQCKGVLVPQLLTRDEQISLIAKYLNVEKVIVVGEVKDSSKNPRSTSVSDIWPSDKVLVAKTADNANDLREPCVGRTFLWEEDSPDMLIVETYRENSIRSDIYRGRGHMDEVLVAAELGQIVTGTR